MIPTSNFNKHSLNFVLIGSGNLGSNVTLRLLEKEIKPVQIINRSIEKAEKLCNDSGCENYSDNFSDVKVADFILIAVNDDSIEQVLEKIGPTLTPIFHTSGSTAMNIFPHDFPNCGVLYPLQSFSHGRKPDFDEIPVLIEASNNKTLKLLETLASNLSKKVIHTDSEDRLKTHIAAVFASNFTNHFIIKAKDYLLQNNLNPGILDPLIKETFQKAIALGGENSQTGPAVREDLKILRKHEEKLKNDPSLQKLYTFVSESIIQKKKDKETKQ